MTSDAIANAIFRGIGLPSNATSVSLSLPKGMSLEQWKAVGTDITRCEHAVMWWMGDWWNYGEREYGDLTSVAEDSSYSYKTWANAASVAKRVEVSRRRESLPWSVHAEVAALDPFNQQRLLAKAEVERWSVRRMRLAVRQAETEPTEPPVESETPNHNIPGGETRLRTAEQEIRPIIPGGDPIEFAAGKLIDQLKPGIPLHEQLTSKQLALPNISQLIEMCALPPKENSRTNPTDPPYDANVILLKDGSQYRPSDADICAWQKQYPALDVEHELREIAQWNYDNRQKRKTISGIRTHVSGWLKREATRLRDQSRSSTSEFEDRHVPL